MNLRGKVNFPRQSLTATTTYNIICLAAPANQRVAVEGIAMFGEANSAQTPGLLALCKAASQGATGTALTPYPIDQDMTETFQTSIISLPSTAPSTIVVLDDRGVNPQIGITEYFPGTFAYQVKGGGFFVVQFTPQWTGNYWGWLLFGE